MLPWSVSVAIGVAVAALVIAASVLGTVASAAHGAMPGFLAAGNRLSTPSDG